MNYLILTFTILFFILAWRRLDLAVMLLIACLPAYLIRFNIFGLPSTILEAMIWLVFLVWAIKNFHQVKNNFLENFKKKSGKIKIRYPFDWEILLLLVVSFTATGLAGFSSSSLGIWKAYFFEPVILFIVIINTNKTNKKRTELNYLSLEKILFALAVSALVVSALAIYQKFTGVFIANPIWAAAATRRVVSFFGYPNAVGLYLAPLVMIFLGWFADFIKLKKEKIISYKLLVIFLTIISSVLSIYFAKSKGALLGVAVGLMVFGLMANRKIRCATAAVALIAAVGIVLYQPARDLALENLTLSNKSGQIRQAGWSDSWRMLKDGRLITGAGLANYQTAVAPFHAEGFFIKNDDPNWLKKIRASAEYRKEMWQPLEIYLYPHDLVLNFWSELGLAGLLLFVWIIGRYFYMGLKLEIGNWKLGINDKFQISNFKFLNIGLICAMVAIVVHGLVDVPYFKNDLAVMFWLLIAMMSIINLESVNE